MIMTQALEIAAGLDLHKKFIIATILTLAGGKMQERFERTHEGLLKLKDWILNNKVQAVGCESTSDYAVNIYDLLNQFIPVIVGNARDIKAFTHKKTDKVDSEFIALLTLKGMIHPSRIMPMDLRNFRALTRLRHRLVDQRTTTKNHIHSILDSEMFLLSNAFTDIFGKAGRIVLNGITNGFTVDEILQCIPKNVKGKKRQLREIMEHTLSADALDRMKVNMLILYCYDKQIEDITQKALDYAYSHYPREMKILKSVPGIGEIAAITILAEIGDIKDFPTPEQFASWLGIVPRVYQSADKLHTGSITKRGSVHARWILVQVAHAVGRSRNNSLKSFFQRKEPVIGKGKAIVALARKIVVVIWHLLTNDEVYDDGIYKKSPQPKHISVKIPTNVTMEEILKIIREAAIIIKKPDPGFI